MSFFKKIFHQSKDSGENGRIQEEILDLSENDSIEYNGFESIREFQFRFCWIFYIVIYFDYYYIKFYLSLFSNDEVGKQLSVLWDSYNEDLINYKRNEIQSDLLVIRLLFLKNKF